MSKTRVTWMGEQARAKIVDLAAAKAERVAEKLAAMIRRNLSTPGPEPSSPGEFPHKQSGDLRAGIRVIQRNQYRFDVVSEADHAGYVESIRPYMERTLNEGRTALEREVRSR